MLCHPEGHGLKAGLPPGAQTQWSQVSWRQGVVVVVVGCARMIEDLLGLAWGARGLILRSGGTA